MANLVNTDYITIQDNVPVTKPNPNPTGEWNVDLPSRTLPVNSIVRVMVIGQVLHSSGSPEGVATLDTGENIRMSYLKKADTKDASISRNIIIGIAVIIAAYFLYKKFVK